MQVYNALSELELVKSVQAIRKVYEEAPEEVSAEPQKFIETPCLKLTAYLRFSATIPANAAFDISNRLKEQWNNIAIEDRFHLVRYCLDVVIFQRSFTDIILGPSKDELNDAIEEKAFKGRQKSLQGILVVLLSGLLEGCGLLSLYV